VLVKVETHVTLSQSRVCRRIVFKPILMVLEPVGGMGQSRSHLDEHNASAALQLRQLRRYYGPYDGPYQTVTRY
jgi:hypothetical protein